MNFREFMAGQEAIEESIVDMAKAGWGALKGAAKAGAGLMTMGDEAIAAAVGDGTKGRMALGRDQFSSGIRQAFLGEPKQSASKPQPEKKWFYSVRGREYGPVTSRQLRDLAASGKIGREDLIWKAGMPSRRKASEASGLFPPESPKEIQRRNDDERMDAISSARSAKDTRWSELSQQLKREGNPEERRKIMAKMAEMDIDRYLKTLEAARGSSTRRRY